MSEGSPRRTRRRFLEAAGVAAAAVATRPLGGTLREERSGENARRLVLGLTTYMFKNYDLDRTIAMARRVGVDRICLRSNLLPIESTEAEIRSALQKLAGAGLKVYAGGVIYMRDEAGVQRAFEYSRAAGFKIISASILPELLALVDRKVREYDIRVAIHNHGPEDRQYPTPGAIFQKVKRFDARIGICHDCGHTLRAGADPIQEHVKTAERIYDVHLKDVDGRRGESHSTELGRGVLDLPEFLKTLRRTGYAHTVGIEYEKHMDDLLPGLAESVGYTRGVKTVLDL